MKLNSYKSTLGYLLLALMLLPILNNLLHLGFIPGSDDDWQLINNPYVTEFSSRSLSDIFVYSYKGQYSPVNTILYVVIYKLFGMDPVYFHLTSFILHLLNTYLIYLFFLSLFSIGSNENHTISSGKEKAIYIGFIFLFHPMQLEAVYWVAASKVLLCSFFVILSLCLYVKYLNTGSRGYYFSCLLFFLLGCLSKEQAVILPILLLIIEWYFFKKRSIRVFLLNAIPFFAISMIVGVFTLNIKMENVGSVIHEPISILNFQSILISTYCYTEYLIQIFVPITKCPFSLWNITSTRVYYQESLFHTIFFFSLLIVSFLRNKKYIYFSIASFTTYILLTLPIFPIYRMFIMADRYVYIGLAFAYFPVISQINCPQQPLVLKKWLRGIIIVYLLYLYACTIIVSNNWLVAGSMS